MINTFQAVLINQVSKYTSMCSGVYMTKDKLKPWGVRFRSKDTDILLGHFEREAEAIQVYTDYHEKYYTEILNQIKTKKEKDEIK